MLTYARAAVAAALTIAFFPALAHHSNSAYQVDKIITLEGTVKEWKWMNPHTWLILEVTGADGKKQEWAVEGRPPVVHFGAVPSLPAESPQLSQRATASSTDDGSAT